MPSESLWHCETGTARRSDRLTLNLATDGSIVLRPARPKYELTANRPGIVVTSTSVPDGDLIWLIFDPQAGLEQGGPRPALALSPKIHNQKSGLALVCPVTNQAKGYPFEV